MNAITVLTPQTWIIRAQTQIETMRQVRKPMPPPTRVERPLKGRGYRRPQNKREIYGE